MSHINESIKNKQLTDYKTHKNDNKIQMNCKFEIRNKKMQAFDTLQVEF